ncbi:SphA family protein [Trinickia diaoshuihuensis]|uniref:SphA family protein n=1 Tax=Trinickia diaoshuihuensis TaxID=2292265 RepID=UPI000E26E335|nr:transporter [Trinickia diaoshuihuensis]
MSIGPHYRCFIAAATAIACWSGAAPASENASPYQPGVTTGSPTGALPPAGFYMTEDFYIARGGTLVDGAGNGAPLRVQNTATSPALLWVPGWKLFGAQFGMGFVQVYAEHDVDTRALGGKSTKTSGFFNTILTPAILSWDLGHGFFTSAAMSVYLPNGHHQYVNGVPAQTSYANDYWTAEPSFAVTYLAHGWNFTINNVFDFNRTNATTDYHSGSAYYVDLTAAKTIGRWTLGVIGNYSRQFTDDRQYGRIVGNGNRFEHVLLGPMLGYNFGRAQVTLRYLQNIKTRNDIDVSFFHASVSFKF